MSTVITKLTLGIACWTCVYSSALAIDPPVPRSKQIADSLVAITQPGYYSALYVTNVMARVNPCKAQCVIMIISSDLTPILYAKPSIVTGTKDVTVVVDVVELKGVATSGPITVKITKDALVSLSFSSTATSVGIGASSVPVQNSYWTQAPFDEDYYIFTTTQPVPAGNKLRFGLSGTLTPGASTGSLSVSVRIEGGSGGEVRTTNNLDADKIDYFQQ